MNDIPWVAYYDDNDELLLSTWHGKTEWCITNKKPYEEDAEIIKYDVDGTKESLALAKSLNGYLVLIFERYSDE